MKNLKGPELKLSQLKLPPILRDVYQDLRDRRLLPLVALVLVAIVAVPFLLSSGKPAEPVVPSPSPAPEASAGSAQLTVVKAAPGLRQPSKRLRARRAKDPFRQHFTGSAVSSESVTTGSNPATTSVTSGESSEPLASSSPAATTPVPVESSGGSPPSSSPGKGNGNSDGGNSGTPANPDGLVYYTFAADLTITKTETTGDGKKVTSKPETRKGVLPSTVLPGSKTGVVTYMGVSPKTQNPLVLVSTDVTGVFGDGKCVAGSDSCQLLEMKPTFPETFVYGENDVRYKINIFKIEPVVTGHS
jgi:hypothetical protein